MSRAFPRTLIAVSAMLFLACSGGGGSSGGAPATPQAGAFVSVAASSLAFLDRGAIPTVFPATPVDTTGWSVFDATQVGGTDPAGPADFTNCDSLVRGGADNSQALACLLENTGDEALLRIPDGAYDFDTGLDADHVFRPRPDTSRRGIVCDSRGGELRLTGMDPRVGGELVQLFNGEDEVWNAPATSWRGGGGGFEGETTIPVASTAGFSTIEGDPGHWVVLEADPNPAQDFSQRRYVAKVIAIGGGSIRIDRPLPDDFNGGNATARAWTPTREFVVRGCTIRFTNPEHQAVNVSWAIRFNNMVESEITDVHIQGAYQNALTLAKTARSIVQHSDITDSEFDKGPNTIALIDQQGSDNLWINLHTSNVVTAFGCLGSSQGIVIAFNDFREMDPNPEWDPGCDEDDPIDGIGDANDCDVAAIEERHRAAHPPVLPDDPGDVPDLGAAYFHCSTNNLLDARGLNGGASCQGTRAGAAYSTAEWHNEACSNSVFMRNYLGGGSLWFDTGFAPGVGNLFYGNEFVPGIETLDVSPGNAGEFHIRDSGRPPAGYGRTDVWANNIVDVFGSGLGYDAMGRAVQVHDNVIRTECFGNPAPGQDPDGADCIDGSREPGFDSTGTIWANNTVGEDVHPMDYARVMPSAPGLATWPDWGFTPRSMPPFIGPEMGDPDDNRNCLPAAERFYGFCP